MTRRYGLSCSRPHLGAAPDRTPTTVHAQVVDEDERAWAVRMEWAPKAVFWFPKRICRQEAPNQFVVPIWFEDQIPLKVNAL